MTNSGVFEEGNEALPKTLKIQEGISDVIKRRGLLFCS